MKRKLCLLITCFECSFPHNSISFSILLSCLYNQRPKYPFHSTYRNRAGSWKNKTKLVTENSHRFCLCRQTILQQSCPGGSVVKNLPANAEDTGLIPGSGRSSREGNGNPLQYSCWEILRTRSLVGYSP